MIGLERGNVLPLLEAYEPLLTSRQASIMDSYFRYDLSLGEIAEMERISRAGVLDAIKKSIEKLSDYESKLGLVAQKKALLEQIEKIEKGESSTTSLKEMIQHGI